MSTYVMLSTRNYYDHICVCMTLYICMYDIVCMFISNGSFCRQIASYQRGVGDHKVARLMMKEGITGQQK